MNVFDITRTLGLDTITIPGDAAFRSTKFCTIQKGSVVNLSHIIMSSHTGTHLDAPYHFFDNLKSLDQLPINQFVLPARVVSIRNPHKIKLDEIENFKIKPGEAILFKTQNRHLPRDCFSKTFVDLSESAAKWLVAKKISLVGIDYLSIEQLDNKTLPVHRILLKAGILILEDIDLNQIEPDTYQLICPPLKFQQSDGAPCRAILIK